MHFHPKVNKCYFKVMVINVALQHDNEMQIQGTDCQPSLTL
jgi:hypothetical protein